MKYRCLIVDDEKLARDLIQNFISHFPYLEVSGTCKSAIEAMQLLGSEEYDIMFLDINMPQLSGLDLLRQSNNLPLTILTTAHSEHALESYELDVVDYLLKPIDIGRFTKAISKVIGRLNKPTLQSLHPKEKQPTFFFVKSEYKKIKIEFSQINYIEAMEKYIRIHTSNERILTLMSMSKIMEQLPSDDFVRIHRSYIVNKNKIDVIEGNRVVIDEIKLPISKANRKMVNEILDA